MTQEDTDQVKSMIQGSVTAAVAALKATPPGAPTSVQQAMAQRSAAEVGSPEFAEDRTQINSLNNKWIFAKEVFSEDTIRREEQQLFSVAMQSLTESVNLSKQLHGQFFTGMEDGRRIRDTWLYNTAYDLANPVAIGSGQNLGAGAVPSNRAIDTGTAQAVLNSSTVQDAIGAAVANALNGTIPTLEAAIGAAVAAALANVPNNAAGNSPKPTGATS
jgi:hypothetical protein